MTAIAFSLAFHACVGVYLFSHRSVLMQLSTPPSDRTVTFETVTFPPPTGTPELHWTAEPVWVPAAWFSMVRT